MIDNRFRDFPDSEDDHELRQELHDFYSTMWTMVEDGDLDLFLGEPTDDDLNEVEWVFGLPEVDDDTDEGLMSPTG